MNNKISLRRRLAWFLVTVMLIMSLATGSAVYYGTTHEAEEMFGASLTQTARLIDGILSQDLLTNQPQRLINALTIPPGLEEGSSEGHEYEDKLFFAVLDNNNQIVVQSPHAPAIGYATITAGYGEFELENKLWNTFMLPASLPDYRIVVGEHSGIRREMTEYILRGLVVPLLLLTPLILIVLVYLVTMALRPLKRVSDEVLRQDFRNLKPIKVRKLPNEIEPLIASLNEMIENLDQAYRREQRFVSDASHELRNPLAALMIHVENALEETRDAELTESLGAMRASITRLSHLVSQLLKLSRLGNPLVKHHFTTINLTEICQQVITENQARANANTQTLAMSNFSPKCEVQGSPELMISLINNLIDNAVKYSGESSQIQLSCIHNKLGIALTLEDSGPGLDEQQQVAVIGRFARADANDKQGAGLGLSIVKSIADAHDAELLLSQSQSLGGLAVTLQFPN